MALPMLLGAAARGLVRGGGRAAASKIMGRRKIVKAGDIKPQTAIVPSPRQEKPGGALVKSPTAAITKAMAPIQQVSTGAAKDDYLGIIHEKVLTIEKIVTGVYKAEQDNLKAKKQDDKDDARKNQEQKLETQDKKPDKKKPKLKDLPKLGVFGWLKRFIGSILMGLFLQKMIDFAGFLPAIIRTIDGITTFLADWGVKIVGALITFVDFGIKAYDFTIGAIEKGIGPLFGDNTSKVLGLIETAIFLTTTIATAMAVEAMMGGGDGGGPGLLDFIKGKGGSTAVKGTAAKGTAAAGTTTGGGVATTAGTAGGLGLGSVIAIVAGAGLLSSALGEGIFQIRKLGKKNEENAQKAFDRVSWFNPLKYFLGAGLLLNKGNNFLLQFFGNALDLVGAPFRYAVELALFGIMSLTGDTEGMKRQRKNLAKFDARVRESLRELYNVMTLGLVGQFFKKGDLGNIFGDKEAQAEMMKEYSEGGKVRKKGVKRGIDIKKKEPERRRVPKPTKEVLRKTPPKEDTGGGQSGNDRAWWDFLGWAGTGSDSSKQLGPGGKELAEKVTKVGNQLGDNDYFGPILRLTSKVILDQDVTGTDYLNVGKGINLLLDDGMRKGAIGLMAYNEGGGVENIPQLDVTKWVKKNFEDGIRDGLKKKYVNFGSTSGPGSPEGEYDSATGEYIPGAGPELGSSTAPMVSESAHEGYKRIYNLAKEAGDPFPEVTAAQWAIESGYGSSKTGKNNPFGQTGTHPKYGGTTLATPRDPGGGSKTFMNFGSEAEAVAFRVKRWVPEYGNATTPYEALLNIQKHGGNMRYAQGFPTAAHPEGDWMGYVRSVSRVMKENGMDPQRKAEFNSTSNVASDSGPLQMVKNLFGFGSENEETETSPQAAPPSGPKGKQIKVGGSNIVNIGKDLISKGFSVAEHPDFTKTPTASGGTYTPGKGYVSNVHQGDGHYQGRAIDVTDWRGSMEDSKARYRSVLTSLQDNPAIKMLIHDSWGAMYGGPGTKQGPGRHSHPEHMHIEVKDKGGFIGKGLFANLGGTEFVTDADSTAALKQVAPGLMMALNQASNKSGIESVLKQYASYEQGAGQTVMVQQDEGVQEVPQVSYGEMPSTSKAPPMIIDMSNSFEFLEYQG